MIMHPKKQLGGKKCGREMEKDTGGNGWEKEIWAKVEWRKVCEEIPVCLKGGR